MKKRNLLGIALVVVVALGLIVLPTITYAQIGTTTTSFKKAGGSGSQFLKIGVGAKAMAMGGAFAGIADDITALYWNPAGIARMKGFNIGTEYNTWFADMTHSFVGFSFPISDDYRIGLSAVFLDAGDIPITTIDEPEGTGSYYSVSDLAVGATIAGTLNDNFAFGITLKFVQNTIYDLTATTIAFDAGTLYDVGFGGLKLGLGITNLGPEASFDGQSLAVQLERDPVPNISYRALDAQLANTPFSLPMAFRGGLSFNVFQGFSDLKQMEGLDLVLAGDFIHLSDNPEKFNLGGQLTVFDMLALRGGYQFGYDELGLTLGGGIMFKTEAFFGSIDYAYADLGYLGGSNRIGVMLRF